MLGDVDLSSRNLDLTICDVDRSSGDLDQSPGDAGDEGGGIVELLREGDEAVLVDDAVLVGELGVTCGILLPM
jgi:hypothetical protein